MIRNFVYITTNLVNGKKYVGSHRGDINDSYLGSGKALKLAFKKYGRENFDREILQETKNIKDARKLEEQYIQKYNTLSPNGYNIHPSGGPSNPGGNHLPETIEKMKESARIRWLDDEERKKQGDRQKGKKRSEKTRKKLSKALKGKGIGRTVIISEESRKKISKTLKGRKLSESHKQNISSGCLKTFKDNPPNVGRKLTAEHKEKIGKSLVGKSHTEETKNKMRIKALKRERKKRERGL